jgi:hypothetical protein
MSTKAKEPSIGRGLCNGGEGAHWSSVRQPLREARFLMNTVVVPGITPEQKSGAAYITRRS